jgi:flagellin
MPAIINTNIASLNAQRNAAMSQQALATSVQRLSSGLRVNSAKDDAAGLAISERMNAQARGMAVAIRNANDGISLAQVSEGALSKVGDALQRMRELGVQARNATNTTADKASLDKEYQQLADEIGRVIAGTTFNGEAVLATTGTKVFQIGANVTANDEIAVPTTDFTTNTTITAVTNGNLTGDATALAAAITAIDTALDTVNGERATYGALQNRFEAVISNLMVAYENQVAARSRIVDADFAVETASLSRANILQQAGNSMIAQANALPQGVLTLLQG